MFRLLFGAIVIITIFWLSPVRPPLALAPPPAADTGMVAAVAPLVSAAARSAEAAALRTVEHPGWLAPPPRPSFGSDRPRPR